MNQSWILEVNVIYYYYRARKLHSKFSSHLASKPFNSLATAWKLNPGKNVNLTTLGLPTGLGGTCGCGSSIASASGLG